MTLREKTSTTTNTSMSSGLTIAGKSTRNEPDHSRLRCDYLVVGAGTSGMAFVDTILTEHPSATIIIVDKNYGPGGHWTKAYPFVRLHQPSCFYGVNSLPLGKHLDAKGNERYDINDRATGTEVLEYYERVRKMFEASGRVKFFFCAEYKFDVTREIHTIVRQNGNPIEGNNEISLIDSVIEVDCRKLVTVASDVLVPSMREPLIPVNESTNFLPVNHLLSSVESGKYNKYVVFGNGKTGVDAITNLLDQGIDQSQITWIVSRDGWYLLLDSFDDAYRTMPQMAKRMLSARSVKEYYLSIESDGLMCRLDPNGPIPEVFFGAAVTARELEQIRSIQNVVRMGRATSIGVDQILLNRGVLGFSSHDTLLVDCMVDNKYGYASFDDNFTIFQPGRINLGPQLGLFNISLTAAVIAFLECALDEEADSDGAKNKCCYFLRGRYVGKPETLLGWMYMESKYSEALMKVKGGLRFVLSSRLNMNAPMHHRNGTFRLIWNLFGPNQMHKFGKKICKKIDSKGYFDVDHCFGIETFVMDVETKEKALKRPKKLQLRHRHISANV